MMADIMVDMPDIAADIVVDILFGSCLALRCVVLEFWQAGSADILVDSI